MALFDHRVFRSGNQWWVAQVHSASGAGWGDSAPTVTRETVYFSSITDRERHTLIASIPPGWLNKLRHGSLVRLMNRGEDLGTHFKMAAYNAPSAEELGDPVCTDEEGLRWAIRPSTAVITTSDATIESVEAAEFVCLDDSALRVEVPLFGLDFNAFKGAAEKTHLLQIIGKIKSTFREYGPADYDENRAETE